MDTDGFIVLQSMSENMTNSRPVVYSHCRHGWNTHDSDGDNDEDDGYLCDGGHL